MQKDSSDQDEKYSVKNCVQNEEEKQAKSIYNNKSVM